MTDHDQEIAITHAGRRRRKDAYGSAVRRIRAWMLLTAGLMAAAALCRAEREDSATPRSGAEKTVQRHAGWARPAALVLGWGGRSGARATAP